MLGLLTSCSILAQTPPDQAVKLAIVQQLTRTQQLLSQSLGVESDRITPNFKIESITVQQRSRLNGDSLDIPNKLDEVYRVKGTFSAKLKAPGYDTASSDSPFEVYLGTNTANNLAENGEVETWFLLPAPGDASDKAA